VFDAVTCRIAAHHFLDCVKAVREMARVLKPGGRLVLEDNSIPADAELDRFLNGVECIRDVTHVRAYNEAEWRAMLAGAGLRVLHSQIHQKVHNVAHWLERAGLDEAGKQRVYAAMAAASPAARRHFEIVEEAGRPAFFTDDKLILMAEKPSA
jgi:ubiquinone/menaquinone biosynthesis C-methylase UbiE